MNKIDLIDRLKAEVEKANAEYAEIAAEEEAGDYGDAMLSMDRTRAEGYAEALEYCYNLILEVK